MAGSLENKCPWGVRIAFLALLTPSLACGSLSAGVHYTRGTEALDAGNADAAIAHLEHAAELVPHASEVQNHLGIAYQAAGRSRDALAAYERAVALDCDNAAAQYNLDQLQTRLALDAVPAHRKPPELLGGASHGAPQ